ncbi:CapA family protein [Paenibacillus sp. GCM10027627]|uniref:CapA family protein n=1 Tax=unclassified Paenibacillus TaxID=185978 RepID=UPI00362C2AAE
MLSRSESRQSEKVKRKRSQKKWMSYSLILIGALVILAGFALNGKGLPDWIPSFGGGSGQSASVGGNGDNGLLPSETRPDSPESEGTANDDDTAGEEVPSEQPGSEAGETSPPVTEEPTPVQGDGNGEEAVAGGDRVGLSFVGDMLPGEYIATIMSQKGYDFPYLKSLLYLSEPDLMAGNLELPITTGGTPVEGTPYVYKGSPETVTAMRDAGFDVLSLANNHALDQGLEGMRDTMKHLTSNGIGYMGVGENDTEAFAPLVKEVKGFKVAYIGVSEVIPFARFKADRDTPGIAETYDTTRTVAAIAKAQQTADLVVVMVHWGEDGKDKPEELQRQYAREYIDAGADLIIGSHPHVLQGFEKYKGKWIAYSLGNFVYASKPKGAHAETGVLDASCTKSGDCELKFNPMAVTESQPIPLEGEAAKALFDRLSSISFGVKLEGDGTVVPD